MIEAVFLIIIILLSCISSFVLGYLFHEKEIANEVINNHHPDQQPLNDITIADNHISDNKYGITSGVGIVYRPSAQELNKMNEDQATREAKEAISETLSKEKEPTV